MVTFPELIQFKAPSGLTAQLASVAEREQLSVSALVRKFVVEQIERLSDSEDHSAEMNAHRGPRGGLVLA